MCKYIYIYIYTATTCKRKAFDIYEKGFWTTSGKAFLGPPSHGLPPGPRRPSRPLHIQMP